MVFLCDLRRLDCCLDWFGSAGITGVVCGMAVEDTGWFFLIAGDVLAVGNA